LGFQLNSILAWMQYVGPLQIPYKVTQTKPSYVQSMGPQIRLQWRWDESKSALIVNAYILRLAPCMSYWLNCKKWSWNANCAGWRGSSHLVYDLNQRDLIAHYPSPSQLAEILWVWRIALHFDSQKFWRARVAGTKWNIFPFEY